MNPWCSFRFDWNDMYSLWITDKVLERWPVKLTYMHWRLIDWNRFYAKIHCCLHWTVLQLQSGYVLKAFGIEYVCKINGHSANKLDLIGPGFGDQVNHEKRLFFEVLVVDLIKKHIDGDFEGLIEEDFGLVGLEAIGRGDDGFAIVGFPFEKIVAGELDLHFGPFNKGLKLARVNGYVLVVEVHGARIYGWMFIT